MPTARYRSRRRRRSSSPGIAASSSSDSPSASASNRPASSWFRWAPPCGSLTISSITSISMQLDEVLEEPLDIVEGVGALGVPCELDRPPDFRIRRLRLDAVELTLEALELARDASAPEQRQGSEPAQPFAKVQLGVTRHSQRLAEPGRGTRAAPAWARSRRGGRSGGSTLPGRSRPGASRAWSAVRPEGP